MGDAEVRLERMVEGSCSGLETLEMYNLDVLGNDNFFVGQKSWLVHNATNAERTIYQLAIGNLPRDPNQLLKQGWSDVTDPRMAGNIAAREYENLRLGMKVRFDPGTPGAQGFEGKNHYHVYNPEYDRSYGFR